MPSRCKRPLKQLVLKMLITYGEEDGTFTKNKTGKPIGYVVKDRNGRQYLRISLGPYGIYYAHRLAWFYMTGQWPPDQIDHIDHDGLNNRWSNMRLATSQQQQWNLTMRPDHPIGYRGIYPDESGNGHWRMQFTHCKRQVHRRFPTKEQAIAARLQLEREVRHW